MEINFKQILSILDELKHNSSNKKKQEILNRYKDVPGLKEVYLYAYNKNWTYGITVAQLIEGYTEFVPKYNTIFELLNDLKSRKLTGAAAIDACNTMAYYIADKDRGNILYRILDRDLGDGVGAKTAEKIWPGLFGQNFSVALADKLTDKTRKKVDFTSGEWAASRKLDGVRCICIKENGKVNFYARSGKEFFTLDVLKKDIENLPYDNFVLDGECCIVDNNGDEDFIKIVSEIKRKNWTIENPRYMVFDCLDLDEFWSGTGTRKFWERQAREQLQYISSYAVDYPEFHAWVLDQHPIYSEQQFNDLVEVAANNGWEGLMLRKDVSYEGKRTQNMLKCKQFQDAEYEIVDVELGPMKWTENGQQVERICVSNFTIIHKGSRVSVGSGLSKEQRVYFAEHPDELKGRTATIKYFQESRNADGGYSLRFPTLKALFDAKRDF